MRLESKVALVSGASRGIGRGVALALAAEGAHVAVAARDLAACEGVVKEITDRGGRGTAVRCDTTSRSEVEACVDRVRGDLGPVDILVNSAQSIVYGSVRRIAEEDVDIQWQSGPMGTLRFMQACYADLAATKGVVVNFGSGSSIMGHPAMGGYAMAKEAIRTLSRIAAVEWGPRGIRVNVICPLAETPGWDKFTSDLPGAAENSVLPQIPLRRMGDSEHDIGAAVVFLASAEGSYITGTTLMVDGGYTYLR